MVQIHKRNPANTTFMVGLLHINDTNRVLRYLLRNDLEFSPWMRGIVLSKIEAWEKENSLDAKVQDEEVESYFNS